MSKYVIGAILAVMIMFSMGGSKYDEHGYRIKEEPGNYQGMVNSNGNQLIILDTRTGEHEVVIIWDTTKK